MRARIAPFDEELAGLPVAGDAYCHPQFRIAAEAPALTVDAVFLSIGSSAMQSVIAAACRSNLVNVLLDPIRPLAHGALAAIHCPAIGRNLSLCVGEAKFIEVLLSNILRTPPALAALDRAKEAGARVRSDKVAV